MSMATILYGERLIKSVRAKVGNMLPKRNIQTLISTSYPQSVGVASG
jgi:hypothetical protein